MNRHGILSKKDLRSGKFRNRNNYWLKKMISVGFIEDCGETVRVKSYQEVWRILGVKQSKKKDGHYAYKYSTIEVLDQHNFIKEAKDIIFRRLVNRKKNQIKHRLVAGMSSAKKRTFLKSETSVELSSKAVAKLLGYAYSDYCYTSGYKYRAKYFKVESKKHTVRYLNSSGSYSFKNVCDLVFV